MRRLLFALLPLALLVSACATDGTSSLLPARNSGWFLDGESSVRVHPSAAGTVLKVTDTDIISIDVATGRPKWQRPLPPATSFVQVFEGDRYTIQSSVAAAPGGTPQEQFLIGDVRTGSVVRSGVAPVSQLFYLYAFTRSAGFGALLDTALVAIDGTAGSVLWTKRIRTSPCRRGLCQFVRPYGMIGSTAFIRLFNGATLAPTTADALWRIEADGRTTSVPMPIVNEADSAFQRFAQTSVVEPLLLFGGNTSVHAVDAPTLTLRWRVLSTTLVPTPANSRVEFRSASEDPTERTLRVTYAIIDTISNRQSMEGIVLRTVDGSVLRRSRIEARPNASVIHAGACGTEGYAIIESTGTIRFARWNSGVSTAWRSSKLERSMAEYVAEGLLDAFVETTGASTLVVRLPRTDQVLGLSCDPT